MHVTDDKMNKAFFLDRDGVINEELDYVSTVERFHFNQGVFEACRIILSEGFKIIIVTNQAGIGRGYYSENQFLELNAWMLQEFQKQDVEITDVYFCPHHPTAGQGLYKKDCNSRKPKPGMLLRARDEHSIDLESSVLVGDRGSDVLAGLNAGLCALYLLGNRDQSELDALPCDSLLDAVKQYFAGNQSRIQP